MNTKPVHIRVITQCSEHVWVFIGLFSPLSKLAFMLIDQEFEGNQCWENNRKCLSFPKASYVTLILRGGIFLRLLHLSAVCLKALSVQCSGPFRIANSYNPPNAPLQRLPTLCIPETGQAHGLHMAAHNTHNYNKLYLGSSFHMFDAHCEPWPFACITCMQMYT